MNANNRDRAVRVNRDEYNRERQELEELRVLKRKLEDEKVVLLTRVRRTEDALKRKKIYRGRNKTRVSGYDVDEHGMNESVGTFVRMMVYPKTKFLHSSWSEYAPDTETSFFYKIRDELEFPKELDPEIFWGDKVVPIVNKKLCETRANIAAVARNGYIRTYEFILSDV